jgi:hypothetical protein
MHWKTLKYSSFEEKFKMSATVELIVDSLMRIMYIYYEVPLLLTVCRETYNHSYVFFPTK